MNTNEQQYHHIMNYNMRMVTSVEETKIIFNNEKFIVLSR